MKKLLSNIYLEIAIVVSVAMLLFAVILHVPKSTVKVYDCSIAEISPDYPLEVKNGCRKLRAENFNKDLQKPK